MTQPKMRIEATTQTGSKVYFYNDEAGVWFARGQGGNHMAFSWYTDQPVPLEFALEDAFSIEDAIQGIRKYCQFIKPETVKEVEL